jgi:hypothetical protein
MCGRLEFGGEEGSNVTPEDALVSLLDEIVERGKAVIHALILEVESLRNRGEDGDASASR